MRTILNACPYFDEASKREILARFEEVLDGMLTIGPFVRQFEEAFAAYCGTKHAVAVHSGASALEAVLRYYRLEGRAVIVPTLTFVASANAVVLTGGRPVFADIEAESLCLSLRTIEQQWTPETAGVMIVNMLGQIPPDLEQIRAFCRERGLFLMEDAAHSHGASYQGVRSGALTDAGCFSFYATKVITAAEGGMVTTDDDEMAAFVRSYRHHGLDVDERAQYCLRPGTNIRMDELRAVVGLSQLARIDEHLARRRAIASVYAEALSEASSVRLLPAFPHIEHSYWKFPIFLEESVSPGHLAETLKQEYGVRLGAPYNPLCHLHPYYRTTYGYGEGDCPVAEDVLKRYTCLPVHAGMTLEDAHYVVDALRTVLGDLKQQLAASEAKG